AETNGWHVASWRLNTLDDIEAMIREIPAVLFEPGIADLDQSARRAAELENAIAQALSPSGKKLWQGTVLLASSNNPVLAFGSGTYLSDVLSRFGCENVIKSPGWVQMSMEDVVRANPQGLMLALPGFDQLAGMPAAAGPLWDLQTTAMLDRRVGVIND